MTDHHHPDRMGSLDDSLARTAANEAFYHQNDAAMLEMESRIAIDNLPQDLPSRKTFCALARQISDAADVAREAWEDADAAQAKDDLPTAAAAAFVARRAQRTARNAMRRLKRVRQEAGLP